VQPIGSFMGVLRRLDVGDARLAHLARLYAFVAVPGLFLVVLAMGWPAADGRHDLAGATLGHDLSQIWVAGRTALSGHAAEVYDIPLHHRRLIETFGPDAALFAWHYPPVFLLVAALIALLPYALAVLVWGVGSVALMACALRTVLGDWPAVIVALALPPVFECLGYGQNSLLTAALLTFGLAMADRRPLLAGLCLGLVCYKPQLAVLAPLAMVATGRWRVAAAACVSASGVVALSAAMFGISVWTAFLQSLAETDQVIFTEAWGGLALNASAFGAVRLLGGPLPLAWGTQICVAILACGATLVSWRAPLALSHRNAVLLAAIPLVSPYVPVYDLAVLVPAAAFFATGVRAGGGFEPGERLAILILAAFAFDLRDATRLTHMPCGFAVVVATFALMLQGAWRRRGVAVDRPWPPSWAEAPSSSPVVG
jgi:hypothetical protein